MKLINTFKLLVILVLAFYLFSCEKEAQKREINAKKEIQQFSI